MGGRYYITGVQIGVIKAFLKTRNLSDIDKLLDDIEEKQFIGKKKDLKKIIKR